MKETGGTVVWGSRHSSIYPGWRKTVGIWLRTVPESRRGRPGSLHEADCCFLPVWVSLVYWCTALQCPLLSSWSFCPSWTSWAAWSSYLQFLKHRAHGVGCVVVGINSEPPACWVSSLPGELYPQPCLIFFCFMSFQLCYSPFQSSVSE